MISLGSVSRQGPVSLSQYMGGKCDYDGIMAYEGGKAEVKDSSLKTGNGCLILCQKTRGREVERQAELETPQFMRNWKKRLEKETGKVSKH